MFSCVTCFLNIENVAWKLVYKKYIIVKHPVQHEAKHVAQTRATDRNTTAHNRIMTSHNVATSIVKTTDETANIMNVNSGMTAKLANEIIPAAFNG